MVKLSRNSIQFIYPEREALPPLNAIIQLFQAGRLNREHPVVRLHSNKNNVVGVVDSNTSGTRPL